MELPDATKKCPHCKGYLVPDGLERKPYGENGIQWYRCITCGRRYQTDDLPKPKKGTLPGIGGPQ